MRCSRPTSSAPRTCTCAAQAISTAQQDKARLQVCFGPIGTAVPCLEPHIFPFSICSASALHLSSRTVTAPISPSASEGRHRRWSLTCFFYETRTSGLSRCLFASPHFEFLHLLPKARRDCCRHDTAPNPVCLDAEVVLGWMMPWLPSTPCRRCLLPLQCLAMRWD